MEKHEDRYVMVDELVRKKFRKSEYYLPRGYSMEDMVQETFLHLWEVDFWGRFDESRYPMGVSIEKKQRYFLYRVISNFLNSFLNSSRIHTVYISSSISDEVEGTSIISSLVSSGEYDSANDRVIIEGIRNELNRPLSSRKNCRYTYRDLFDRLVEGDRTLQSLSKEFRCSTRLISDRKAALKDYIYGELC